MNFTAREKKFLTFLAVVLLAVVYLNLFLRPQIKAINALKGEIQKYSSTYSMNVAVKQKVERMDSEIKILSQKLKDLRSVFPPVMNYDEILIVIRDTAKNAGMDITNISFSEPIAVDEKNAKNNSVQAAKKNGENTGDTAITDSKLKEIIGSFGLEAGLADKNGNGEKGAEVPNGKGYVMSVKLSGKGTNAQIKNFINSTVNLKNKAAFSDIQITNSSGEELLANMTIDFYGIMDRSAANYTLLEQGTWTPLKAAGTNNMFKPYQGFTGPVSTPGTEEAEKSKTPSETVSSEYQTYDFTMRVLPFGDNMAPPTVSLVGRSVVSGPGERKTPITYGDNKGIEKVNLYIEEKDGKFYCKFRTESEAFPDEGYSQMAEFKPIDGAVKLLIDSMPRKFKQDNAGVNVNIINKTSKDLMVKVINEDKFDPRVKIDKSGDNVMVVYQ